MQRASEVVRASTGARPPSLAVNVRGLRCRRFGAQQGPPLQHHPPRNGQRRAKYDVDVVLVCWGAKSYAAAQRARRDVVKVDASAGDPLLSPELAETASRLARTRGPRQSRPVLRCGGLDGRWAQVVAGSARQPARKRRGHRGRQAAPQKARRPRSGGHHQAHCLATMSCLLERAHSRHGCRGSSYSLAHGLSGQPGAPRERDDQLRHAVRDGPSHSIGTPLQRASLSNQRSPVSQMAPEAARQDIETLTIFVLAIDDYLGPCRDGPERCSALLQAMLLTKHLLFVRVLAHRRFVSNA